MRETRQSGSEGGVAGNSHPYPYTSPGWNPGFANRQPTRSEGTPHPPGLSTGAPGMRRSFRTHPMSTIFPGLHPGMRRPVGAGFGETRRRC